jgi:hypothetical protein
MVAKILTQLESLVKKLQLRYMADKRTTEVVEDGRILFHPGNGQKRIMLEYQKKLKALRIKIK